MIKTAISFGKSMVMTFDGRGEQMPEYQGRYEVMRKKVLRSAPPDAVFATGFSDSGELKEVPRSEW